MPLSKATACGNDRNAANKSYSEFMKDVRELETRLAKGNSVYIEHARSNVNKSRQEFLSSMGKAVQTCGVKALTQGTDKRIFCTYLKVSTKRSPNMEQYMQKFCAVKK